MNRIYVIWDLDGSYWVLKELDRVDYPTHSEHLIYVIDCAPRTMCRNIRDKVAKMISVDIDYFTLIRFFVKKTEIRVVSGGLKAVSGYLGFLHGYRLGDIIKLLQGKEAITYREMYYSLLAAMESLEGKCKEALQKTLEHYTKSLQHLKEAVAATTEVQEKTLGFVARPEGVLAIEAALAMTQPPPPPPAPSSPAPPPPPPKKSALEKLKEFFGKLQIGRASCRERV